MSSEVGYDFTKEIEEKKKRKQEQEEERKKHNEKVKREYRLKPKGK